MKRAAAMRVINEMEAEMVIYTDGSAEAGCRKGGSAVIVTSGPGEQPIVDSTISTRGASYTNSY